MTPRLLAATCLLLAWSGALNARADEIAPGLDLDARLRLDAPRIATTYAASDHLFRNTAGWSDLSVPCTVVDPRSMLTTASVPPLATFVPSTYYDASVPSVAALRKVKRKLFVDVAAYDGDDVNKRWEGLEEYVEATDRGKTVQINDGLMQGDLTLGVGTGAQTASVGEVLDGQASAFDLNPLRDVSAQFDFLIRTSSDEERHWGFNVFVIRIRAAYQGAFNGVNSDPASDQATESEYSISWGVVW